MTAFIRPRAIRVAFLVEESDHWPIMFDAIFADCHSRWGGRFNLLIPCENGAVLPSYLPWLEAYDPDIIYSYVDLTEQAIASLHEQLSPSFLIRHVFHSVERNTRSFAPKLPMPGLSSLSVCMVYANSGPFTGRRKVKLVDAHTSYPLSSHFLQDNFGLYAPSMHAWPIGQDMADYAQTISLVPKSLLDDPRMHPTPTGEAITDENDFLARIAKQSDVVGLAQLSAWLCPRLELHDREWGGTFNLIVGSTFVDRITFWNARSRMPAWLDHELVTMNVTKEDLDKQDFFSAVAEIIKVRATVTSGSGSQAFITLRSASVPIADLNALVGKFKSTDTWKVFTAQTIQGIDHCIPSQAALQQATPNAERGLPFRAQAWHKFSYLGDSFRPPTILPRHLRDVIPLPAAARLGLWAQDIDIERSNNHSRYSNVIHRWRLPRRLRVMDAFNRGYQLSAHGPFCLPRVTNERTLAFFTAVDGELPDVRLPTDEMLFRVALCTPNMPWPFVGRKYARHPVACEIQPSDKGQYLMALLNRSGGLNPAVTIFLKQFWKEQFERFGGTPASTEQRLEIVTRTLKKRLKAGAIEKEGDWERIAKLVLAEARAIWPVPGSDDTRLS